MLGGHGRLLLFLRKPSVSSTLRRWPQADWTSPSAGLALLPAPHSPPCPLLTLSFLLSRPSSCPHFPSFFVILHVAKNTCFRKAAGLDIKYPASGGRQMELGLISDLSAPCLLCVPGKITTSLLALSSLSIK